MNTVLVALAGLTPQILTETLYALLQEGEIPSEIHVLTTLPGRQKVRELLLDPHKGAFYRFCSEYGIDHRKIRFDLSTVHVFSGPDGRPIEDLRAAEENTWMADQIVRFVKELAERPDVRIHASLAGGRKTMTFYLGYALSLFGRPQDRLTHVLVPEDFESHPEFFYPPRKPLELRTEAEKWINTADARIDLVEIPFLRLRDHLLPPVLEDGFEDIIRRAQEELSYHCTIPEVHVVLRENRVVCRDVSCRLSDQPFAVYVHLLLVRRMAAEETGEEGTFLSFDDLTGEKLLEDVWTRGGQDLGLAASPAFNRLPEMVDRIAQSPRGDRNFVSVISKINRALETALPSPIADHLRVRRVGKDPTRYGVRVPRDRIAMRVSGV